MRDLVVALLEAQRAIGKIKKDGRAKAGGSYRYTSAEHMIGVVREALHEAGLLILPDNTSSAEAIVGMVPEECGGTVANQTVVLAVAVHRSWQLCHPESGGSRTISMSGVYDCGRGRPAGKATAAANTELLRDMLRDLLLLPKGEGDEARVERPVRGQTPAPQAVVTHTPAPQRQVTPAPVAPVDPAPDDLEGAGWSRAQAVQLCAVVDPDAPAPWSPVVRDVHFMIQQGLGEARARAAWRSVGVESLREGVSWGQLRRFALFRSEVQE